MKITVSKLIYNILINIPVCFALSLAGALIVSSTIDWANFAINFSISFVMAMLIGLFVPLTAIGRWFTALFHVKNDTYTHNLPYRILATFISSCIFYFAISPVLTLTNYFLIPGQDFQTCLLHWLINLPFMFLVGFLSTLISDVGAYKAAHRIDATF
jgi:drug/metabolite transporter (DMT)-like permease